jgi:hypothetical protein
MMGNLHTNPSLMLFGDLEIITQALEGQKSSSPSSDKWLRPP